MSPTNHFVWQEEGGPDSTGSGYVQLVGSYERDNEIPGSIKSKEFLEICKNNGFSRRTLFSGVG
jgi:hypothetical protein